VEYTSIVRATPIEGDGNRAADREPATDEGRPIHPAAPPVRPLVVGRIVAGNYVDVHVWE